MAPSSAGTHKKLSLLSVLLTFKIFEACADFLTPDGLGSCRKCRNFGAHCSARAVMRLRLGRAGGTRGGTQLETGLVQNHSLYRPI